MADYMKKCNRLQLITITPCLPKPAHEITPKSAHEITPKPAHEITPKPANEITPKSAHEITPIKSPVIKGHLFLVLSYKLSVIRIIKIRLGGRHGCDCVVVGFTTTYMYAISAYHH
jgi:hypothetical protein